MGIVCLGGYTWPFKEIVSWSKKVSPKHAWWLSWFSWWLLLGGGDRPIYTVVPPPPLTNKSRNWLYRINGRHGWKSWSNIFNFTQNFWFSSKRVCMFAKNPAKESENSAAGVRGDHGHRRRHRWRFAAGERRRLAWEGRKRWHIPPGQTEKSSSQKCL